MKWGSRGSGCSHIYGLLIGHSQRPVAHDGNPRICVSDYSDGLVKHGPDIWQSGQIRSNRFTIRSRFTSRNHWVRPIPVLVITGSSGFW